MCSYKTKTGLLFQIRIESNPGLSHKKFELIKSFVVIFMSFTNIQNNKNISNMKFESYIQVYELNNIYNNIYNNINKPHSQTCQDFYTNRPFYYSQANYTSDLPPIIFVDTVYLSGLLVSSFMFAKHDTIKPDMQTISV